MNTNQPLVSLIIAVLNSEKTLEQSLQSVFSQDYAAKEVILIDGASTDGSVDIIKKNEKLISYWESKKDRGVYHAWNKALEHVNGDWICFLGADDFYCDNHVLSDMIALINDLDIDIITTSGLWLNDKDIPIREYGEKWSWEKMKKKQCFSHPGTLYNQKIIGKTGKFNEQYRIAADYEFNLRMGAKIKTAALNRSGVCIRVSGISWKNRGIALREMMLIQSKHKDIGAFQARLNFIIPYVKYLILNISKNLIQ